ncbi:hypothetical protein DLAC_10338 [Tieghemostelium lacteum]|uniref:B box-type domain-containing protein n=1 Tax=Tieghemostelium lacteum TaxID=361077 RepID=A0A151Z569_TIELA|nr:hypothetical protein DLAC_10338 [Tieghemostelium lacteum]|eukprot:KYQ89106.1 hypothetical protein DLAC_10338 [Tieghemostelium lacteum]
MIADSCTETTHIYINEQYCKSCKTIVCSNCRTEHKDHELVYNASVFTELMNDSHVLLETITKKVLDKGTEKEKKQVEFKEEIQDHYDSQLNLINSQFRLLHDLLHLKEVELKRELKSYHEDNIESLTSIISTMENDIENNNRLIKQLQNSHLDQSDSKSNFLLEYTSVEKEFKKLNNNNNNNNQKNNSNNNDTKKLPTPSYTIATMNKYVLDNIQEKIETMDLSKKEIMNNQIHGNFIVYRMDPKIGVTKINLKTGQVDTITGKNPQITTTYNNRMYQYNSHNSQILLFEQDGRLYTLDTAKANPEWEELELMEILNLRCLSTIYVAEHQMVYIFGGYIPGDDKNTDKCFKFNLQTRKLEEISKLFCESGCFNLTIDLQLNQIFIIGGYVTQKNEFLNRIDSYNFQTNEMSPVVDLGKLGLENVESGIWIPTNHSFYLLSKDKSFVRLDIKSMAIYKLISPPIDGNVFSSTFQYNNNNELIVLASSKKSLYKYLIEENQWITMFDNLSLSFSNYLSFSNK